LNAGGSVRDQAIRALLPHVFKGGVGGTIGFTVGGPVGVAGATHPKP